MPINNFYRLVRQVEENTKQSLLTTTETIRREHQTISTAQADRKQSIINQLIIKNQPSANQSKPNHRIIIIKMFITETVQQFIRRDSTAKTSYRYKLREQLKSTFKIDQQIQQINRYINQSINQCSITSISVSSRLFSNRQKSQKYPKEVNLRFNLSFIRLKSPITNQLLSLPLRRIKENQ